MVIKGLVHAGEQELSARDAIGIWETDSFNIKAIENSELLIIDVPMN